ncbi:hypothetical protein L218DRAFT_1003258 [Marasmius fiardii PR-910]|nr:hypothetical protein L218DRAFT_1003258 [Marasmius fiardii PR-910]
MDGHRFEGRAYSLPTSFLGNHTPRLKEFIVRGPCISWNSSFLRHNLTTLTILHNRPIPNYLPECDYFLQILGGMPSLQVLQLVNAVPTRPKRAPPPSDQQALSLPNLRRIALTSVPAVDVCYLLDNISFPPHALLRFILGNISDHKVLIPSDTEPEAKDDFSRLVFSLWRLFSQADGSNLFTSLRISSFLVLLWGCHCNNDCFGRCSSTYSFLWIVFRRTTVAFLEPSRQGWWHNLVRQLWSSLAIAGLRSLEFGPLQVTEDSSILFRAVETFGHLERLSKITVGRRVARTVVESLGRTLPVSDTDAEPSKSNRTLMFPALRELEMDVVIFDEELFGVFRDSLMIRLEYRVELLSLSLRDCDGLFDVMVSLLRELVADVRVK